MKTIVMFLTALCICFAFASVVEGQQQAKSPLQSTKTTDRKVTIRDRILDDRVSADLANLAGQTAPAAQVPRTAPSVTAIEGTWSVTPLVMKGVAAPGGSGQLLEIGDVYTTESFLAFWARTGLDPRKDWVLFSWKDGQLTRVLQRGVEFVAPDSRKVTVRAETPIHVGKRLLYFSPKMPDHVYAWDGEKMVKVLCAGDELQFGNERYTIKRARVLDASPDGKALIGFENHTDGWAVHDGSSFTPLLKRGGGLPGMPGVSVKDALYFGMGWYPDGAMGYKSARLLEDGSVLASLKVSEGGRERFALFRVFPERTEVIVEQRSAFIGCDAQRLIFPSEASPICVTVNAAPTVNATLSIFPSEASPICVTARCGGPIGPMTLNRREGWDSWEEWWGSSVKKQRLDSSHTLLSEADGSVIFSYVGMGKMLAATPQAFAMHMQNSTQNQILVSYAGKFRVGESPRFVAVGESPGLESWVFLAPDSPRMLAAEVSWGTKGKFTVTIRSNPSLYFWNGEKLASVAWEESIGISTATVGDLLQRPAPGDTGNTYALAEAAGKIAHIRIRAIPGPIGGVSVQLPALGDKPRTWYVPANSMDGKLQQPPRFAVAEHPISLADVISWKQNEVLALTEEGFFRLRRAEH